MPDQRKSPGPQDIGDRMDEEQPRGRAEDEGEEFEDTEDEEDLDDEEEDESTL